MTNEKVVELGEMEESALIEAGNILSGTIVGSISNFMEEKITLDQPHLHIDYPVAIIDQALKEQTQKIGWVLFVSVKIFVEGEKISLTLLFIPCFDLVGQVWKKAREKNLLPPDL
jgi:chemotaxis protein CheY-P-specific phosphatase CheC